MSSEFESRNQSMPNYEKRESSENGEKQLRSVISNLRSIILKYEAEIDRLQRQLAEERVKNLK